jgi:hypothetical protein
MPAEEQIGSWTSSQLTRYVQQLLQDTDFLNAAKRTYDELAVVRKLTVDDEMQFMQTQSNVGAAGGASALPATPAGYIRVLDPLGKLVVIPYYASS